MPTGTFTRKIQRHDRTARITPPATGPTMLPTAHVIELMPMARPRSPRGKASVMMAMPLAISIAPPTPWTRRKSTSWGPLPASAQSREPTVKTPNPRLYMRTRPNMSARRPKSIRKTVLIRM